MVRQQQTTIALSDSFQLSDAAANTERYRSIVTVDEVSSGTDELLGLAAGIRIDLTVLAVGIPHLLSDRFL